MTTSSRHDGKPATIYDVARRAEVSHQTVALFLRGHEGFRPATRDRIEQALVDLRYRPNLAAKALATATSHRIGALVYALDEAGPNRTIQGASNRAREAGYVLDLMTLDPSDPGAVRRALDVLGPQSVAGLLAFAPIDRIVDELSQIPFSVPFIAETEVQDDAETGESGINRPGLDLLVDHLVGLGHRRFVHLGGPPSWAAARNREQAYIRALARHGLESLGTFAGTWSAESGYDAARRVPLDRGITAIVAADDQMALGAMLALSEQGLSIPRDVSVTGFDDLPETRFFQPPLTTVRIDYALQGRLLVERLLASIKPGSPAPASTFDEPALVVRASTGPAPASAAAELASRS